VRQLIKLRLKPNQVLVRLEFTFINVPMGIGCNGCQQERGNLEIQTEQGNRAKHTIVRKSVYQQSIVCLHGSLKPIRIEQSMITNDLSDGLVMHVEGGCA